MPHPPDDCRILQARQHLPDKSSASAMDMWCIPPPKSSFGIDEVLTEADERLASRKVVEIHDDNHDIVFILKQMMQTMTAGHEAIQLQQQEILSVLQVPPDDQGTHMRSEQVSTVMPNTDRAMSNAASEGTTWIASEGPPLRQVCMSGDQHMEISSSVQTGSSMGWKHSQSAIPSSNVGRLNSDVQTQLHELVSKTRPSRRFSLSSRGEASSESWIKRSQVERWTRKVRKFVLAQRFDCVMGFVIFANAIYIGIQINDSVYQNTVDDEPILEHIFLSVYIVEFSLRVWATGGFRKCLSSGWNVLDFVFVVVGVISLWILSPVRHLVEVGIEAKLMQQILILRLVRLLRLVRALRLLSRIKILWGLVNGLFHASGVIFSTLFLLLLMIYIFGCAGVVLVTKNENVQHEAEHDPVVRNAYQHFDSLPVIMLTLLRFTTADSIGPIYEPIVKADPWLFLYFLAILLVISIVLMNLITAVLVEHSITMAKSDREMQNHDIQVRIKSLVPQVEALFAQLDKDGDGQVTLEEMINADAAINLPREFADFVSPDTLLELFDALDEDDSGSVDRKEFVEGIVSVVLSEVPLETIKMLHHLRQQRQQSRNVEVQLRMLCTRLDKFGGRQSKRESSRQSTHKNGESFGNLISIPSSQ